MEGIICCRGIQIHNRRRRRELLFLLFFVLYTFVFVLFVRADGGLVGWLVDVSDLVSPVVNLHSRIGRCHIST